MAEMLRYLVRWGVYIDIVAEILRERTRFAWGGG